MGSDLNGLNFDNINQILRLQTVAKTENSEIGHPYLNIESKPKKCRPWIWDSEQAPNHWPRFQQ